MILLYIVLVLIVVVLIITLNKQLIKVNTLEKSDAKYRDLKENHEELKDAYDTIINKYYISLDEIIDLEKKIDNYEEILLAQSIEKSLEE